MNTIQEVDDNQNTINHDKVLEQDEPFYSKNTD